MLEDRFDSDRGVSSRRVIFYCNVKYLLHMVHLVPFFPSPKGPTAANSADNVYIYIEGSADFGMTSG